MIKLQNYDKAKQQLTFLTDMDVSVANAIRRSVLEIPVLAVDEVEISKNDSSLYDEILAHRIGLIPIETKGNKEIKFSLKEKGPKVVCATDMKPSTGIALALPIVILDKEQEIEIVCEARLGKGIDHVKYSPGLAYYRHNVDEDILDFVRVDEQGKVFIDEEDLKNRGLSESHLKKVKGVKEINELLFTLESWGQIDVRDVFTKAIDALQDNLEAVEKAVK